MSLFKLRDFSNWIKDRIEKYGFIEGKDFSPNLAKSTGGRPAIDYLISLSMAKELAIVENNSKSQEIKRFLTEIELQNHSKVAQNGLSKHEEKTVTTKELANMLGVSVETIRQTARRLIEPSKSIWRVINGGKSQVFNEAQATAIKKRIEQNTYLATCYNIVEAQNGLSKHEEKTMTVKEVAEVLGVSRELITKRIRELFPEKMQRGSTTYLNEAEVTVIKKRIEQNAHLATSYDHTKLVDMPKTNLEKQLLIRQAIQIQNEMIAELEAENEKLKTEVETQKPKAEYYDALMEIIYF